jgi:hypothetical protein
MEFAKQVDLWRKFSMSRSMSNFLWVFGNIIFFTTGFALSSIEKFYFVLAVIGGLQLLLALYIDIKSEKSLFKPLVIYEVVMYLFLFGQCLMWMITEDYSGRNIIDIYSKDLIEKAEIFTLISMFFFHIALFSTRNRNIKTVSQSRTSQLRAAMYLCGKLLLCVTLIPEIVYNIRIFIIAQSYGYAGIYDIQTSSVMQVFLNLREFFFPAVVLTLCGDSKNNRFLRNTLVAVILLDALFSLYVGSRSDAMMQIISLVLVLQVVKTDRVKSNKGTVIKYIVLFVVLIMTANVVRVIRIMPNRDISTFFGYLFSSNKDGSDNMVVGIMGELGGSMATLMETMMLVPSDYSHLYGSSYFYALTWLIPGFLTNNVWQKASMNNWIDTVRYTGSGWGFSTTAEAYFNFGFAGVLVFIIIGCAVGKLFKGLDRDFFEKNPVEFALSFILFNRLLIFSRIDFLSTVPTIVYFYFGIKIFIHLIDYANRAKGG